MNQIFAIVQGDTKELITTKHSVEDVTSYVKEELSHKDNVLVVQRKTDLSKFNSKELLSFYNKLTSKNTKKFASYSAGLNQVWKFLAPKDAVIANKPAEPQNS